MIVLDANILVRAVLGVRVRRVIEDNAVAIRFAAPDNVFDEARQHLPAILESQQRAAAGGLALLEVVGRSVLTVPADMYGAFAVPARRRLVGRDEDDWPVLATALYLGCPIWTEDRDFFGCGVATWTSDRIAIFLEEMRDD